MPDENSLVPQSVIRQPAARRLSAANVGALLGASVEEMAELGLEAGADGRYDEGEVMDLFREVIAFQHDRENPGAAITPDGVSPASAAMTAERVRSAVDQAYDAGSQGVRVQGPAAMGPASQDVKDRLAAYMTARGRDNSRPGKL